MKDRISTFMKSEGLTAMKFAEIMEIRPSNVSHIISGRSNPGFEFIARFMQRFPEISPDWLINGTGEMYRVNQDANQALNQEKSSWKNDRYEVIDNAVEVLENQDDNIIDKGLFDAKYTEQNQQTNSDIGDFTNVNTNVNIGDAQPSVLPVESAEPAISSNISPSQQENPPTPSSESSSINEESANDRIDETFANSSPEPVESIQEVESISPIDFSVEPSTAISANSQSQENQSNAPQAAPSVDPVGLVMPKVIDGDLPQQIVFFYDDNTYKVFKSR